MEALEPLDQQWWPMMPSLAPVRHAFLRRPFIRIDRLQDQLSCVIVSHVATGGFILRVDAL